jgi:tripartite-type tricarboxylate transporter receptor subunit TctC
MSDKLGQPIVVENRPGAATVVGTKIAKDAPADGYTILAQSEGFLLQPRLTDEVTYDPLKDFQGLGLMVRFPFIMLVGADKPDRTAVEFVARAKANPKKVSFASGGVATPPHLQAALFLKTVGADILHLPYKGNGAALPDVAGGRVDMIFDGYISSASYIKGNKLRPLAIAGAKRIAPLPDVPTLLEQGINYSPVSWLGFVVRTGTPKEAIDRLSEALLHASRDPQLSARLISEGSDPAFDTPAEFDAVLAKEYEQMGEAITTLKLEKH